MPQTRRELWHSMFLCLATGVGEEIFFRGHLIQYATHWFGSSTAGITAAVLAPGLIFALSHRYQGPRAMAQIALMATLFGVAYVVCGNLWPLIAAHFLLDAVGVALGVWLYQTTSTDAPTPLADPGS